MNLSHLSDDVLLSRTEQLAKKEREILTALLHHLREIEKRRLYSALKFPPLHAYTIEKLRYSSDQADRRIAAMRLLKELPEIEEKIASGAFTLTNLGMAKTVFNRESYSRSEKLELLSNIENKSVREAARVIATVSPEALRVDKVRPVSGTRDEIKFTADQTLYLKLEKLKGLLAHSHPGITLGELVDKLADLGLKEWDKTAAPRDSGRQKPDSAAGIRREVFRRDQRCTNCNSMYALETDHQTPKALGGDSTLENFRLLCRKCNQRAAIEVYGINNMEQFLKSPSARYESIEHQAGTATGIFKFSRG